MSTTQGFSMLPQERSGRAPLGQEGFEGAAHQFGQGPLLERDSPCEPPVTNRGRQRRRATGDEGNVRAGDNELLGPGVETASTPTVAADVAAIAGQFDDRLGRPPSEHRIAVALPLARSSSRSSCGTVTVTW